MTSMPRAARAPHSSKLPEACPHCGSHVLTRRGTRKKKLEIVQLWRCASCKRVFTPGPASLRNKTYPLRTVLDALSTYSLGYSLEDTVARIRLKSGRKIGASTLAGWLTEHKEHSSYLRLRETGRHRFPPAQTIRFMALEEALAVDAVRSPDDGAGAALQMLDHPGTDLLEILRKVELGVAVRLRPKGLVGL
jgi:transposase-like protein